MTLGITGLRQFQVGKESVVGTPVACTTFMRMEGTIKDESKPEYPKEDLGYIRGVGRQYIAKSDGSFEIKGTPVTFEQLPYFCNMGVKGVAGSQDGTGSDYIYTYPLPTNTLLTPYTYTMRHGDNAQAEIMTGLFAEELTIKGENGKAWMVDAKLRGIPGGTTTFTGALSIPTVEEAKFGLSSLFIDDVDGTIGTTQVEDGFRSFELKISKIFTARWQGNGDTLGYTRVVMNGDPKVTLKIKLDHDASAIAERALRRATTSRLVRIMCEGAALGTAGTIYSNKTILLDIVGSYMTPEPYSDDDGVTSLEFEMATHYNATAALGGQIVVVNELSTLP